MASMTFTLSVPDAKATDVLNTVTDQLGYSGEGTRKAFLDASIKDFVRRAYIDGKLQAEAEANRVEEDALREAKRAEEEAVRVAAEGVNITV